MPVPYYEYGRDGNVVNEDDVDHDAGTASPLFFTNSPPVTAAELSHRVLNIDREIYNDESELEGPPPAASPRMDNVNAQADEALRQQQQQRFVGRSPTTGQLYARRGANTAGPVLDAKAAEYRRRTVKSAAPGQMGQKV